MPSNNIDWNKLEEYLQGNRSLQLNDEEKALVQMMAEYDDKPSLLGAVASTNPQAAWESFYEKHISGSRKVKKLWYRSKWAAAAAIVGVLVTAAWLWLMPDQDQQQVTRRIVPRAVEKVTLVLPDNKRIELDSAGGSVQHGVVSIQFNAEAAQIDVQEGAEAATGYNTVLVPRGKKFKLTLEDGTLVWLNADSRFRFPAKFAKGERTVELEGEGYFEVTHTAARPFVVKYNDKSVRVLGTRFNINAYYASEAVTLLQGSIEWNGLNQSVVLQPGQQVQVSATQDVATRYVKAEDYILWIQNTLLLENKPVKHLFNDIERHYDVEIRYKGPIADSIKFSGAFEFPPTLDEMLSLLNSTGKVKAEKTENYVLVEQENR